MFSILNDSLHSPDNWLAGTNIEKLIGSHFDKLTESRWRRFLYEYCLAFHQVSSFDALDKAFDYLELIHNDPDASDLFAKEFLAIKEEVRWARGEPVFSLSVFANSVDRMLDPLPLDKTAVQQILTNVWEAYHCQEEEKNLRV